MIANKSRDTKIELALRKALWQKGIRYRKNFKVFSCTPDIVITKYKIAIFCDGDFWHGKRDISRCSTYWSEKIKRNIERDLENTIVLRDNGWIVLRYWETEIKKELDRVIAEIIHTINLQRQI